MAEKHNDMEYLHKYKNVSDFTRDYDGSYYHEPWVSLTEQNGEVHYNKKPGYWVKLATSMGDTDHVEVCSYWVTGNTVTIQLQDIVDWIGLNGSDEEEWLVPTLEGVAAWYVAFGPAYNEGNPWMNDSSKYNPSYAFYDSNTFWDNNEGIDIKKTTGTVTINFGQGWINAMKNAADNYARQKLSTIQIYMNYAKPEISYDMAFGDGPTVTCDALGTLSCESLEDTAVTYPIVVHVFNNPNGESESEQNFDFVGTLRFNNVMHETWGDVYYWKVYDDNENPYDIECYCDDGIPTFFIPE